MVAVHGQRLAEAMALPYAHPRRDHPMDAAFAEVPELLGNIAQEAAALLWLSHFGRESN